MSSLSCALLPSDKTDEPIVVFTFDDGDTSIATRAFPMMCDSLPGSHATHFLPASWIGNNGTVSLSDLKKMEAYGWETGGHGYTHANFTEITLDSARIEIARDDSALNALGLCSESFAWPSGNYNDSAKAICEKYFQNLRTSHDYMYTSGVDRTELGYFAVRSDHSVDDLMARLNLARESGSPMVVFGFHMILPDSSSSTNYWCKQSVFAAFLSDLKREGICPVNIREAMQELGQ